MSPRWQASQLQLDLDPQYTLIVKWHTQRLQDSSKASHQRPKCGQWPSSWNLPPSPRQSSHSLAYGITQPMNNKHTTFKATLTLCNGPHSVCGVCFSEKIHILPITLSLSLNCFCTEIFLHWILSTLNSFCIETRTWASLGPETRSVSSAGKPWILGSNPNLR